MLIYLKIGILKQNGENVQSPFEMKIKTAYLLNCMVSSFISPDIDDVPQPLWF